MKKHLLAVAVTALAAGSVFAQANDTLAKIKASGSITLGVRESSGALAYTLGDGKYVGFHTEMAERITSDLRKQLGMTALDIKYQPVTSQNRIPLVTNGTVDLECGSPAGLALNGDVASHQPHDLSADRESESRTLRRRLSSRGLRERLEQLGHKLFL